MAVKSLLVKNMKQFTNEMSDSIHYVDIDYEVKRPADDPWTTHTRSLICKNDYAILNGYRMWLQSKRYDYIRAPLFGGFFENALNDKFQFKPENEQNVSQALINETAEKWPDIIVLECKVTCNMSKRSWDVHIIAQDKWTKMILQDPNISIFHETEDPIDAFNPNSQQEMYDRRNDGRGTRI